MTSSFMTMAALQMQLFLFIIAGFVLTKTGTISPAGRKFLSDLLINFILPCNIICSFQLDMTREVLASCGVMLLLACATQLVYLLISRFIFPGAPKERLACLRYGAVCSNAGFLGLPIIGGVFGPMGTLLTSVALIPQRVVMWSAGLSLFTHTDGKSVVRKLLTHPCIVAVFIGFALMLAGNPVLPGFIQKALSGASGSTTCISMLVIGSILAAKYDGDAPFASCLVFVSTLLSLVTLPLLCLLFRLLLFLSEQKGYLVN